MPHTILEYSDNILDGTDFQSLWERLHAHLVATAPCRIQDIKSRAYRCAAFRMGDGGPANAFVHLTIRLLDGRDEATLARVGEGALEILRGCFPKTLAGRTCDLTVELESMPRQGYFKASSRPA